MEEKVMERTPQQSGAVPINELGGRFGMALSALRGEFDPGADVENTEKGQNLILGALVQFPAQHTFNVVVKPPVVAGAGPIAQGAILREMQGAIARFDMFTCSAAATSGCFGTHWACQLQSL
eukprot:jgi/Astpho2/2910/Aster-x1090